jgi:heme exporter protein C
LPKKQPLLTVLNILAAALVLGALVLILFFTPEEAQMGAVQKVFYFHVASAWAGMLSFVIAAVAGALYLAKREMRWDWLSLASIEVGIMFGLAAILSGMIWAHPIWNTWWVWEPRLTTTAIMELIYLAYFILRGALNTPEAKARLGAVFAIVSVITVPLTFFSIRLYRTIHPVVFASGGSTAFTMSPRMWTAFIASLGAFTVLLAALIWNRARLAALQAHHAQEEN